VIKGRSVTVDIGLSRLPGFRLKLDNTNPANPTRIVKQREGNQMMLSDQAREVAAGALIDEAGYTVLDAGLAYWPVAELVQT
jgi:hypothetical protein